MKANSPAFEQVVQLVQSGFYKGYNNNKDGGWYLHYDLNPDDYANATANLATDAWIRGSK